jgi:hypothetical protein
MTDYTKLIDKVNIPELVKALRHCVSDPYGFVECDGCPIFCKGIDCQNDLHNDTAAVIEELEKELGIWAARSFEGKIGGMALANLSLRMEISKLKTQLPKRGEWIWDDKRCIYVCSVCGSPKVRENMDRQIIKEQAYCYSCGAKMEVQE